MFNNLRKTRTPSPSSLSPYAEMPRRNQSSMSGQNRYGQSVHFSIMPTMGQEGKYLAPNQFEGHSIAVFTSGGDSQGMNAAVRAVVRMGIYCGCQVYFIREGYQGMVDGDTNIVEASWDDVSGIMQIGGTVIGSARCMEFREKEGRLKAAKNLVDHQITNLVVIGGDGSLTGAYLFREDWNSLLNELVDTKQITAEQCKSCNRLNIVGLVGSIDNDFCGTDMTIGTDSALHRILEATDAIMTTAQSHQRCFVMEVMGRHCGYLAMVAAMACEADHVFLPENPPEPGWEDKLCNKLLLSRQLGNRVNIIIVSEGAIDMECKPIPADYVRQLISDRLKFDTRLTVLGHVQRGGAPSAFDRVLGIRMGCEAVLALMDATKDEKATPVVISLNGNHAVRVPLMDCVKKTRKVAEAMANKDFALACKLRGKSFNNNLSTYIILSKISYDNIIPVNINVAVVNVGAPACGVNAALRSFARYAIAKGYHVKAIHEGFRGLQRNSVTDLDWNTVRGWAGKGGSCIGARRTTPVEAGLDVVASKFKEYQLHGLFIIGGYEAFVCLMQLYEARERFPEFRIPMIVVPATISNNVPGSDLSLGCDTSVNEITCMIDKIKQSAQGTTRRVFVVETMGGYCGYLATMSGLAGGADAAYIYEEPFSLDDLREDVNHLRSKMEANMKRGLILRADMANHNYSTDFIYRLFMEESKGVFDCRMNILGHVQQGGVPTPFDRNLGTKMGARAIGWLEKQINSLCESPPVSGQPVHLKEANSSESAVLLGQQNTEVTYSPIAELKDQADFVHRLPKHQWWVKLRSLMRIMSQHDTLLELQDLDTPVV